MLRLPVLLIALLMLDYFIDYPLLFRYTGVSHRTSLLQVVGERGVTDRVLWGLSLGLVWLHLFCWARIFAGKSSRT